ncbi:ShlB/FhaC/HecB family hemolysin secretion/activation protein [Pseudomonadota bacterium]
MCASNFKSNVIVKWEHCSFAHILAAGLFVAFSSVGSLQAALIDVAVVDTPQAISENPGDVRSKFDQLIHQDTDTVLDVPAVYKRPLGVDAGPRVHVKKFVVTGVNEWPKHNISQERIDRFVEKLRLQMQTIDAMNEYGLTEEDMEEIAKRLKDSLYSDDEAAAREHAQFLKELRKNKKFREEMSIGQLQDVANQVTDLYRSAGFVIAQAYIPEQKIEDGIVSIHVQEGTLGQTLVEGNESYSTELIRRIFEDLEGKSVTKQSLENGLFSLSDYPGLVAYGVLQPGQNTGETDLLVKVQEEDPREYTVRLDNYGTESTGENRLTLSYTENNLFGNADSLDLSLLQTFSPTNNLYGGIKYKTPVGSYKTMAGLGLSNNAYDVGGLQIENISGEVSASNIFVSHQFVRSRSSNLLGKFEISRKSAETKQINRILNKAVLSALVFEASFDVLDKKYKGINQGTIKYTQGLEDFLGSTTQEDAALLTSGRKGKSEVYATSDFTKLNWNVARLQLIDKHQNLLLRLSGQYSGDLLVPVEQSGLGGPNNVRAFAPSVVLRDSSVFLSVDWNFNAPFFYNAKAFDGWKWGEILQLSVFADYVKGTNNDATADEDDVSISGYGVAAQLLLPGKMQLRLDIGKPFSGLGIPDPVTSKIEIIDDVQFYLTFSYTG